MAERNIILLDPAHRDALKPFTWARPVSSIRIGILTIAEKWQQRMNADISYDVPDYLVSKFPIKIEEENILIQAHLLPSLELTELIKTLSSGEFLVHKDSWVAAKLTKEQTHEFLAGKNLFAFKKQNVDEYVIRGIQHVWDIFQWNEFELNADFELITRGRMSQEADASNKIIGNELFIEEGAKLSCSIINTTTGPVYIGKNAMVMEGCMIRGSLALCEQSQLKMGAKIYGATTIGPDCRVGGEVNNSVIQGYSNKAHDGFLGNSVVGEWCNIGADSNNSNLKNNYDEVKVWNYSSKRFIPTGTIFCGLMMGDHAKCGINTMFNTGTVVGYGANVFGDGFPRQYIPEFAWGGAAGFSTFQLDKFYQTANAVMGRREKSFSETDQKIARFIFNESMNSRSWEKAIEN
jgi:UDP-N-acetylglucosamine diphosphorylase/glucosamine-1-phosphate N-acetyltransferase